MTAETMEAWHRARNILCIRLDYLGDVLMCTPALRALKSLPVLPAGRAVGDEHRAAAVTTNASADKEHGDHQVEGDGKHTGSHGSRHLTLLTSSAGAAAAKFLPDIDAVIEFAAPWMKSSAAHDPQHELALIETLRARAFDAVVIFTTYSQSALPAAMLCYLAGIPLRLAHCRENPYQLLTDWAPDPEPHGQLRHEVRRQLDLVATIGSTTRNEKLSFVVPAHDLAWARRHLVELGIAPGRPWLLLHPGATAPSRRYPARHWAEVVRQLTDKYGLPLVISGSAGEEDLIAAIVPRCHRLVSIEAGTLTLGQLGALITLASVVISNNTGPAHLAAAVGTPLVDLYALTNPQHLPWQVESRVLFHDVPCKNCYKSVCPEGHHDCLEKVEPERVVAAALQLLALVGRTAGAGDHPVSDSKIGPETVGAAGSALAASPSICSAVLAREGQSVRLA